MKDRVTPLLELCFNHLRDSTSQNLEKNEVYAKLFPGQEFLEGKLEKVMVEAHKIVRAFLLVQHYFREENDFQQGFDFSKVVHKRGLTSRYQQLMTKLHNTQESVLLRNSTYVYHQFLLEYAEFEEASVRNQAKGDLNIPKTIQALELYSYYNRLELLNQLLLQQKITRFEVPDTIKILIDNNSIPAYYLDLSPPVKVNFEIFKVLKKKYPEPFDVHSLFDLLLFYEKDLDSNLLRDFYGYLRNICVLTVWADYAQVEMELVLHELHKDNLKRGFLHYEGKINRSKYWMVSHTAMKVNDFAWALEFIEKFKHEIRDENESKDLYRLNLANYLFRVGRFSECLDNIPASTPFVDYLLQGKRLELKALYELRSDLLTYKLDAFKMFLSRTSKKLLSENQKQIHSDFANLLHQLIHSLPGDTKRSELLVKRILEKKQSAEWPWLLEKAKDLKGN
ncbi:MAG: hypothetical protein ACKVU0_13185 [Saprospiraceae bacterium]